jgi:D-aminoacyl-tRNA deacylase
MKAVLQRVTQASVKVGADTVGSIGPGLAIFVGVANGDTERDVEYLATKVLELRIFADASGKFNLSAIDVQAGLLLVSQFTLLADARKGRRPSFVDAAPLELAKRLFDLFVKTVAQSGLKVETGKFQEHMLVEIHNDGPVTIMLDSRDKIIHQDLTDFHRTS